MRTKEELQFLVDEMNRAYQADAHPLLREGARELSNYLRSDERGWLIEAAIYDDKGRYYLCVLDLGGVRFEWKPDVNKAIRFARKIDADLVTDAVRMLRSDLFPAVLPYPRVTEHMWMNGAEIFADNPLSVR